MDMRDYMIGAVADAAAGQDESVIEHAPVRRLCTAVDGLGVYELLDASARHALEAAGYSYGRWRVRSVAVPESGEIVIEGWH